jgi:hypothetical protein
MASPLSVPTYGSRHQTDFKTVVSTDAGGNHRNIVTVNFYGGTSLQAQELNEIQEQIQNQTTNLNKLLEKWPVTTGNEMNAFSDINNIGSVITVDPTQMTVSSPNTSGEITINLDQGSHLIIDSNGFSYFVNGITLNDQTNVSPAINRFKKRYVNSTVSGWDTLQDSSPGQSPLNNAGAGRLQWYNPTAN